MTLISKLVLASLTACLISGQAYADNRSSATSWQAPACPEQFLTQLSPEARDLYATLDNTADSGEFKSFVTGLGFKMPEVFAELLRCDQYSLTAIENSFSKPYGLSVFPQDFETNGNPSVQSSEYYSLSMYKGHFFLSGYFANVSMNNPLGLGVLKQQAWIEWDRANKRFIPHSSGAESFILKSQVKGNLYRGASVTEFKYLLSIKRLIQPQFDPSQLNFVRSSIENIVKNWRLDNPQVLNILGSLETIAQSSIQVRTEAAKILVCVVSRYPAILTGTIRNTAALWAFKMSGPDADNVVEVFDVSANTINAKVFEGFYAGTEFGYFEIGFITPDARLFLISRMRDEPITREMAEREFPHLRNQ